MIPKKESNECGNQFQQSGDRIFIKLPLVGQ